MESEKDDQEIKETTINEKHNENVKCLSWVSAFGAGVHSVKDGLSVKSDDLNLDGVFKADSVKLLNIISEKIISKYINNVNKCVPENNTEVNDKIIRHNKCLENDARTSIYGSDKEVKDNFFKPCSSGIQLNRKELSSEIKNLYNSNSGSTTFDLNEENCESEAISGTFNEEGAENEEDKEDEDAGCHENGGDEEDNIEKEDNHKQKDSGEEESREEEPIREEENEMDESQEESESDDDSRGKIVDGYYIRFDVENDCEIFEPVTDGENSPTKKYLPKPWFVKEEATDDEFNSTTTITELEGSVKLNNESQNSADKDAEKTRHEDSVRRFINNVNNETGNSIPNKLVTLFGDHSSTINSSSKNELVTKCGTNLLSKNDVITENSNIISKENKTEQNWQSTNDCVKLRVDQSNKDYDDSTQSLNKCNSVIGKLMEKDDQMCSVNETTGVKFCNKRKIDPNQTDIIKKRKLEGPTNLNTTEEIIEKNTNVAKENLLQKPIENTKDICEAEVSIKDFRQHEIEQCIASTSVCHEEATSSQGVTVKSGKRKVCEDDSECLVSSSGIVEEENTDYESDDEEGIYIFEEEGIPTEGYEERDKEFLLKLKERNEGEFNIDSEGEINTVGLGELDVESEAEINAVGLGELDVESEGELDAESLGMVVDTDSEDNESEHYDLEPAEDESEIVKQILEKCSKIHGLNPSNILEHLSEDEIHTLGGEIMEDVPKGFEKGYEAEEIKGATNENGRVSFLIKWKGTNECDLVDSKEANIQCPQTVIAFYEKNLRFHPHKKISRNLISNEINSDDIGVKTDAC